METYDSGNAMHKEGAEAAASSFPWYCPESFVSTPKKVIRPPPGTQFNPDPCFPVTPLRWMPPMKGFCSGIKPMKYKKQKISVAGSIQIPSEAALKPKQSKKSACKKSKKHYVPKVKGEKKKADMQTEIPGFDLSLVPSPFCSCTSMAIGCYKWGSNGWQSACCNSNMSEYPLPTNPNKRGARVPGRKMSNGAYAKLVMKLAAEGHNLSEPIDLKDHWAKHGTNKFVTIK